MFHVLHSSAGAGKTHALVKHYLGHCLGKSDHGAYRHVLALTFTNKAAAEMKERVIGYLEGLAKGGPYAGPLADVAEHLTQQAGIDANELARRADVVLGHMLHHWGDVAISTIDAFTRRVVKPFARDLRLDQDLRMTTEQDYYREEAVNAVIDRAGSDDRTTDLLTRTCLQLLHEERPWDPTKPLLDLSRELTNERSIGPLNALRERSMEDLSVLMERLNVETTRFRRQVNAIGLQGVELFERARLAPADITYKGAILSYFRKLSLFVDQWEPPGAHTLAPLESGKWNSGKAEPWAIAALNTIAEPVTRLFHEAERLREEGFAAYVIQRAISRELLPSFALHEIDGALEELKRADGVAFFSDLTRRVSEVVKDEPVPFIYERLGERYRHFLIDEFQDTSLLQWNALLPLLDHALSSGGSLLLVGDAKQAIYRWRNGEVRLFVELPRLFALDSTDDAQVQREATLRRTYLKGEPLLHNRRSAQRIIAFNNALFATLPKLLRPELQKVYDAPPQEAWRADKGTVRMTVADPALRGPDLSKAIAEHALNSLRSALQHGYLPGEVAVLVRSKRVGRSVAEHLLAHGHAVVSPDGLQLAADPAVRSLIECLNFILHGDDVSAARVAQGLALIPTDEAELTTPARLELPPGSDGAPDPQVAVRAWLERHGNPRLRTTLAALVEELARAMDLRPAEDASLLTFLDEVHAWSNDHAQDISGFLEHWERSGGNRSNAAAEGSDAVQVMTVHKSKGLQFPVVIIPDARMTSSKNHGELFWVDPGNAAAELDSALVRESKALRALDLPELVEEQALRDLDALNLLYVALTRPEQQLHVFIPHATDAITKGLIAFVATNPDLASTSEEPAATRKLASDQSTAVIRDVATPGIGVPWEIRTETTDEHAAQQERLYGTTVHALLASVRTPEDLEGALVATVLRGDLAAEEADELRERLDRMLVSAPLQKWFAPGADMRAEAVIITGDGHSLIPDRIVRDAEGTHVLEIKTGKPAKSHEKQLRGYLEVLRSMGQPQVTGTIWYVADGTFQVIA
ncbi:MAG: UvrD-helicase domain-containing protein [Flavobacteriales bacterium]|nr:UvrD-helicase domain-containing protein [Flavobacteriales bacterium]